MKVASRSTSRPGHWAIIFLLASVATSLLFCPSAVAGQEPLAKTGVVAVTAAHPDAAPWVGNANVATLGHLIAAAARVRSREGFAKIVIIGNSKTAGSTTSRATSWPSYFAATLSRAGVATSDDSWWGNANAGGGARMQGANLKAYSAYDPRITWPEDGSWSLANSEAGGPGGALFRSVGNGSAMIFRASMAVDRFDLWIASKSRKDKISVLLDGRRARQVREGRKNGGFLRIALSSASPFRVMMIANRSKRPLSIAGGACRILAMPKIAVYNWGWGASTTPEQVDRSTPWTPIEALPVIAPDLTIISLDTNDYTPAYGPVPLDVYRTNLGALISAAKKTGDCLIVPEIPSSSARQSYSVQNSYHKIEHELAEDRGCALVDITAVWGGVYETKAALGWYSDLTHGTAEAYAHEGELIANSLLAFINTNYKQKSDIVSH